MRRRPTSTRFLLLGIVLSLLSLQTTAQEVKKPHSAKKAGIMSACLPGLGQIYNGKWWKTPIVYAGLGGLGYYAYSNYSSYKLYLTAYQISTGDLPESVTPSDEAIRLAQSYASGQLQSYKESYRRDFELSCLLLAAWYGLNIVDAIVDGHLYTYDISDDLSLSVDPYLPTHAWLLQPPASMGLSFNLNF